MEKPWRQNDNLKIRDLPVLRNPNIMWPWWHEIMRKKEKGEIPMEMPGYMLAKFRNECEEKWTSQRSHEFEDFLGAMEAE
eukprot:Skav230975  [mRNA]  locus=scaffold644:92581:93191:+ [translate_table: standard]